MAQYGAVAEASKNIWDFDPTSIAGCTLWLDGADATTMFSNAGATVNTAAGGDVLVWRDKSISGNNAQSAVTNTIANTGAATSANFPRSTETTISYCVPINNNTNQYAQGVTTGSTMSVTGVTPSGFNVSNATISNVIGMFSVTVNGDGTNATYTVTPSTLGLMAGVTVVVFGFSNGAFNGTFTMATQTASTFTVANLTNSGGTLTGGSVFSSNRSLLVTVSSASVGSVSTASAMTTGNYTVINTQYPTRGSDTLSFNGNQYMSLNASLLPTGASNATYFCVSTVTSGSTRQAIFGHGGNAASARNLACGQAGNTDRYYFQPGNITGSYPTSPALTITSNNLNSLTLNNQIGTGWSNGDAWTTRPNQDQQQLLLLDTATTNAVIGMSFYYLLQDTFTTGIVYPLTGTISEILVFNTALSNSDREHIEGYLAYKWGITLPSAHPYFSTIRPFSRNFVPTDIDGCQLWIDPADTSTVTLTSSRVTTILDKSGQGNNVTNASSTITYASTLNGLPVLLFPTGGVSNSLTSPNITRDPVNHTYFFVIKYGPTSVAGQVRLIQYLGGLPGGNGEFFGHNGSTGTNNKYLENNNNIPNGGTATSFYTSPSGTNDQFYGNNTFVVACVRQNAFYTFSTNGVVGSTSLGPVFGNPSSGSGYGIFAGAQNAVVGDVIVYNAALNATQRQMVEGYLVWKWGLRTGVTTFAGLSVPTSHPYYRFPPPSLTPVRLKSQFFNRGFSPYDLSPTIWLDPQDTSTYTVDANNRATSWRNKGTIPAQTITITTVTSTSILTFTGTSITNAVIGQPIIITGVAIAGSPGLTPGTTYYIKTITSQTNGNITVSSTPGGAEITTLTNATGLSVAVTVNSAFTIPLVGTGTGISGPLVTTSSVGAGLGQRYFDFSNGGTFNITSAAVGASPFTALTLTTEFAHNIPVGAMISFVCSNGTYPGGVSATQVIGPYNILSAIVGAGGTTLTITTQIAHGISSGESVTLTINTGTFLSPGGSATSLSGTYTAQAGTTASTIVLTIASSTVGQMAILDGHVRRNIGTSGHYLTQSGTTGSTIVLTSYSARASAGALSNFIGRVEYGVVPFTSAILTSTTSMTIRTPIDHGITSGSVNVNFNNLTLPFAVSLPTTGTALGHAGLSFTSATVSGVTTGTTLTISGITNPFFVNTSPTPTYTGFSNTLSMTFPTGTFFADGTTSATGRSGTSFAVQAGSNATTLILTIASSPSGSLIFNGAPGTAVVNGTAAGSFINNTQTITSASGNTIVIPFPTYPNTIVGRILQYPNPSLQITLSSGTTVNTSYINYPVNGYALENTALVSRLNTSAMTIVWVSYYNPNHYNPSRNRSNDFNNNSPVIAAAVALNGGGGADTTSNGRDFKIVAASFAGNAPRLSLMHNNTNGKGNFFNFNLSDTTTPFRVNSCVMNFTGSSTSDVPASTAGVATYGWRYEPSFINSIFQSTLASQPSATLAPTHLRIGGNTNATTTYATHPLSGQWYEGGVGDILIFNSILVREQRQLVEGFLAHKYRCQVTLGAPVASNLATYAIGGGSIAGSGPFTVTLTGSFPNLFILGSIITIAGVTNPANVYNGTRTVLTMTTGTLTFQSATNIGAWVAGGTVAGSVTFVHPYRLNDLLPSGSNIYSPAASLWLDAADPSTFSGSGTDAVQWNDKSGNNRHATNNGGSVASNITYVTNSQNGLAGVQIVNSASTNGLITPSTFPMYTAQQVSFFVVARVTGTSSPGFISNLNSFALWNVNIGATNVTSSVGTNGNIFTALTPSPAVNLIGTTFIVSLTVTPTSYARGFQTLYINGTSRATGTGTIPTTNPFNASLILSRDSNTSTVTYYELIAFANAVSDIERQQIEGYLAWKWDLQLSLPTTHPYYRVSP